MMVKFRICDQIVVEKNMTDLTKVSSNDVPVGRRSTFDELVDKYVTTGNCVTKSVYRDILQKRFLQALEDHDELDNSEYLKFDFYECLKKS